MCGIYGEINGDNTMDKQSYRLNMLDHRGPDYKSYFYYQNIFLGHTRLSIIDTSENANQPMEDERGVLIFNGEIYNYKILQEKYLSNESFATCSDTEVLLKILGRFGNTKVNELNGMFAFAYYYKKKNTIILGRDRMGIKPLYYHLKGNNFQFSSEIKALSYELDKRDVVDSLLLRRFQSGFLPFGEVREFPKGTVAEYDIIDNKLEIVPFYEIKNDISVKKYSYYKTKDLSDNTSQLEELLSRSINLQLNSDAKVAALCSGGVDSSLISAISSESDPNIELYHAGVEGLGGEERYAEIVSKHLNKNIEYVHINAELFWKEFPYVTWVSDLPIYHPNDLSLHHVAKLANKNGVKVMLSGEGADELFGGYSWHKNLIQRRKVFNFYESHPIIDKIIRKIVFLYTKSGMFASNVNSFENFMPLGAGYSEKNIETLVKFVSFGSNNFENWKTWQNDRKYYEGFDTPEKEFGLSVMLNNLGNHLGSILHRTDRILMANSIEGRVPFLDNNVISFALNQNFDMKVNKKQGKFILKKVAEKYLPNEVIYRKKAGFPVPWQEYTKSINKILRNGFICNVLNMKYCDLEAFFKDDIDLKFHLISFEVWGRIFLNGENYKDILVE